MHLPQTESLSDQAAIDALDQTAAAALMISSQIDALSALTHCLGDLIKGSNQITKTLRAGGKLVYVAAGSSGLIALADASELPGTFGISQDQISIHMAGGVPTDGAMLGDSEDDTGQAQIIAADLTSDDTLIVLSASGTTPFAVEALLCAKAKGTSCIAIANNPNTPLLNAADIAICINSPAEVIAGSTRLGAGTAQKAALNIMSTLAGIQLGHVFRGMMVNLLAGNDKLRLRAQRIVQRLTHSNASQALNALRRAHGNTKLAVLIAKGADPPSALRLLDTHKGHLAPCFDHLERN